MSDVLKPADLFDLSGKRAAVVGGTGVLGGRFVSCLSAAGAQVVVLGRSVERGEAVVDAVTSQGGRASFIAMDATDTESVGAAAETLGTVGALDILVNAPGTNSTTTFETMTEQEWGRLLDVNLSSVFRTCQAFAPLLSQSTDSGSIINISSSSSGPPLSKVFAYGVAKAGVNNLTQYLARELAKDRVRVNAIIPGFFPAEQNRAVMSPERIDTIIGHTPLARLGVPSELDGVLLWLASSRASGFVTGALVNVDGGFSAMTI